ncbi:MAG: tetratricopeptide repeat protein [Gemmatimonadota bacterium]|jgi:tetratricopeptide (TPR) repeat protein|nr:tetratricopeptide repeat protein [Gemmatimonadota bacterium]MDQ8166754.1 tetratricopeptide repeat protein [Gemmatimonadota bacterium]MDQ8171605.1 tetratricopeptide repeat protein [Gemmatimonadota bacterium]
MTAAMSPSGSDLPLRYDTIRRALDARPAPGERERLKQEIIALFREADAAAAAALAFKASVKELVEVWKQLDGGAPATAPAAESTPVRGLSGRVDHLGASTFIEKGWSKLSLGDPAGAEVALRRALELAPMSDEAETLLGWAQMLQQQYEAATHTFGQVLARDPEHALALTNMGYISLRTGRYGEAIEHLSRAIRLDRDRKATLYAHLYLGMVYREREMYDDAATFFRRALALGPNLLESWYELGHTYWRADQRDEAIAAWRAGAEANKFSPWGKRCAEMLGQVEQGVAPSRAD